MKLPNFDTMARLAEPSGNPTNAASLFFDALQKWIRANGGTIYGTSAQRTTSTTRGYVDPQNVAEGTVYVETDGTIYQMRAGSWVSLNVVLGASSLTHDGALTMVSATDGTLAESAITDDATNVTILNRKLFEDSYGAFVSQVLRRANGTSGAPSAVLSGEAIAYILWRAYGASAFPSGSSAWIAALATENHTNTAHGTRVQVAATANGSASASEVVSITSAGVSVTGDVDVSSSYKVAGTKVVGARGAALTSNGGFTATAAGGIYVQATAATWVTLMTNLKTRVDELEARLQAHGLIT